MVGRRETGNETYVLGLIEGMAALDEDFELFVYHAGRIPSYQSPRIRLRRLATGSPWTRLTLDLAFHSWREGLDVLHTSYVTPVWAPCPVVVTVHDISYAVHPEWFSSRDLRVLSAAVPWSMRRASRVITGSEYCRQEIIEHYRIPENKVTCIYDAAGPAAEPISAQDAEAEVRALGIDTSRPIVLAVGNLQPRKNLVRLIKAFEAMSTDGVDANLLIVGPEHFRSELVRGAASETVTRVQLTGYLSNRQLAACYSCATVLAFPSLFEGFGIPAVEAMAHGTPVACSRAGSLPEVCGDAAIYFDPLDFESIAEALTKVLQDSNLRAELSRQGLARHELYSWHKTAGETLALYHQVSGSRYSRQAAG